jgi:hypothetical protein
VAGRDIGPAVPCKLEEGVDRRFQRARVPLDLGEEKAALERGQEGNGEGVGVGAVRELSGLVQAAQPLADDGLPLPESVGQQGPGERLGLRELACERAERAAALALFAAGLGDDHVAPGSEPLGVAEVGLPLAAGDDVGLVADDGLHELVLVGEVVVHLRPAHRCRRLDVVEGGARHASLVDQPGGRRHDPRPGPLPLGREPRPAQLLAVHSPHGTRILGLTTHFWMTIVGYTTHSL